MGSLLVTADELTALKTRDQALHWMMNHTVECRHCRNAMNGEGDLDDFCKRGRKRMGLLAVAQEQVENDAAERAEKMRTGVLMFTNPEDVVE